MGREVELQAAGSHAALQYPVGEAEQEHMMKQQAKWGQDS